MDDSRRSSITRTRIQVAVFGINAGEQGLVLAYQQPIFRTEVWNAFYEQDDYERGTATLAEASNLADITHDRLDVDLRSPDHLGLEARIDLTVSADAVRAIPFRVGENLRVYRLERQLQGGASAPPRGPSPTRRAAPAPAPGAPLVGPGRVRPPS